LKKDSKKKSSDTIKNEQPNSEKEEQTEGEKVYTEEESEIEYESIEDSAKYMKNQWKKR